MDPRLHAFYIDAVFADFGRRSSRLAGLADHEHAHDERPLRRASRRAGRAAGRPARRRRGPSVPRTSWRRVRRRQVSACRRADQARARGRARACSPATASSWARTSFPTRRCSRRCARSSARATRPSTRSAPQLRAAPRRDPPRRSAGRAARGERQAAGRACSRRCWPLLDGARARSAGAARDRGPALGRQLHPLVHRASWRARSAASACWWSAPTAPTSSTAATRCGRCWPSSRSDPYTRLIELTGFTREEMAEQLAGNPRRTAADPELVERVYSRSEGNAAVHRGDAGRRARRARHAAAHAARRADAARGAAVAARAGACSAGWPASRSPTTLLVAAVAGLDPAELRDALREAVASQIVVTVGDEQLRLPPRPAARGGLRRPAAGRADRDARGARAARSRNGSRAASRRPHHCRRWRTTGPPPATSLRRSRPRARGGLAAERVNAFARGAGAASSARSALWERVPDPEAGRGHRRSSSSCATPPWPRIRRASRRARRRCLRRALELVDAEAEPAPRGAVLERISQSLWSQHRQDESVEALRERAGAAARGRAERRARDAAGRSLATPRMLQSRFAEAQTSAREALERGARGRRPRGRGRALNALGTALGEQRRRRAGRAPACASRSRSLARLASRWR